MSFEKDFQPDRPILVQEQQSKQGYYGIFNYSNENIETRLISFAGYVGVKEDQPIVLLTEGMRYITLFGNYSTPASVGGAPESGEGCDKQFIHSNLAIVGSEPWGEVTQVKQLQFTIPKSKVLLESRPLVDRLHGPDTFKEGPPQVFSLNAKGMKISVWYSASYQGFHKFPSEWQPTFTIDLEKPCSVDAISKIMFLCSSFLSFSAGVAFGWAEPELSSLSPREVELAMEEASYFGFHKALFLKDDLVPDLDRPHPAYCPYWCLNEDECTAFASGLAAWIDRSEQWLSSYELFHGFLRKSGVIGAERLLAACKCLEQIPGTKPIVVEDDDAIEKVIVAAQEAAREVGLSATDNRVKEALKRIGTESHEARFRRIAPPAVRIGGRFSVADFVSDLKLAMRLRGFAAHQTLRTDSDKRFNDLSKATSAVECLCYLLLLKDLPLTSDGKERAGRHLLVQNYTHRAGL